MGHAIARIVVKLADHIGNDREDLILSEAAFALLGRKTRRGVYRLRAAVVKREDGRISAAKMEMT
jgi:hypothetical protein